MFSLQFFCYYHLRKMPFSVCDYIAYSPVYRMYQVEIYANSLSNNGEW